MRYTQLKIMTMKIKKDHAAIERCRKVLTSKFYLKFIHVLIILKLISMDNLAIANCNCIATFIFICELSYL